MVASGRFRSICSDRSDELTNIGLGVLYFCRDFFTLRHRHNQPARCPARLALPLAPADPPPVSIVQRSWFSALMGTTLAWRVIELSGRLHSLTTAKRVAT